MSRFSLSRLSLTALAVGVGLLGAGLPATPTVANPIERVLSTPTGWLYYYGITPAQLGNVLSSGNFRIVDLQVESASSSGPVFTVALVSNTGVYGKGWWWYYGQTLSQVSASLSANNARLISIAPYVVNGSTYFASVMVPNTGSDAKSWYWWVGSASQVISAVNAHSSARVIDIEPFATPSGEQYAVIQIGNSGADADSWWWYIHDSFSGLQNHISSNNAQLLVFNSEGTSLFDSAMQGGSTAPWWYYSGIDANTLSALVAENGARLTEIRSDFSSGSRTFNAVMIDNSTTCTTRIIGIQHANGTGWNGDYLKEIAGSKVTDGPVPCVAADSRPFEPASAIKIVIGTYVMHLVQLGQAHLTDTVPLFDPNNFCSFQQIGTESLQNAVTQMLQNSDNARTDMLLQRYGISTINNYAHSLGMANTTYNSYIDCPGPHNTLTLDDAALIYTDLVEAKVFPAAYTNKLFSMMAGRNYDFSGTWVALQKIAQQVAPGSLTSTQFSAFIAGIKLSYKAGGYTWPGGIPDLNGQTEYGDVGIDGYVSLPVCAGTVKSARKYVFGFFHESTASSSDQNPEFTAIGSGAELLREQLTSALKTWGNCS